MEDMTLGLKNCPFCGCASARSDWRRINDGMTSVNFIRCSVCGAQTRLFQYKEDAAEAWNMRASEQENEISS